MSTVNKSMEQPTILQTVNSSRRVALWALCFCSVSQPRKLSNRRSPFLTSGRLARASGKMLLSRSLSRLPWSVMFRCVSCAWEVLGRKMQGHVRLIGEAGRVKQERTMLSCRRERALIIVGSTAEGGFEKIHWSYRRDNFVIIIECF